MRPALTDQQRKHRTATSGAMKRHAEARQCPMCGRKGALVRILFEECVIYLCRWRCAYERAYERKQH